jgi:PAS domain S-box-containing protein
MKFRRLIIGALILIGTTGMAATETDIGGRARLTRQFADSAGLAADIVSLASTWLYHPGDNESWSEAAFDDSEWEPVLTTLAQDSMPSSGWTGIGWFRLHLAIDPDLVGEPLAYRVAQMGAAELYIDGHLVYTGGRVGHTPREEKLYLQLDPDPCLIVFEDTAAVVAVRFSNHRFEQIHSHHEPAGFILELSDADRRIASSSRIKLYVSAHQWSFTGACSVLALVFLLIFVFSHRNRQDLFFALLAFSCAMISYWPFELHNGNSFAMYVTADMMFKLGLVMAAVFGVRFLYELFYLRPPRQYWFFLVGGMVYLSVGWMLPLGILYAYYIVLMLEMVRVVTVAVVRRRRGALTVAVGFALFGLSTTYQVLMSWGWLPQPVHGVFLPYMSGILALLVAMSFHLAREFALTNAELTEQLGQVNALSEKNIQQEVGRKLLQKDIEHKEKQLEEAARLEQALADLESAHAQLQEADNRTRKMIDASPVPLIVTRIKDGLIMYANKHLGRLVGYSVDDLEGQNSPDFYYDPNDRMEVVERLERDGVIENHEVRIKHSEGTVIWCLFSLATSRIGDDDVIIGGLYDISERKEAEEKLKLYRRIFESSQDGVMVFDTDGRLIVRNPAHRRLSGLDDEEVKGKSVLDLVPETARQAIRTGLETGSVFRGEFEWPPIDGNERPIDLSVFTIPDAEGRVMYSVGIGRDISARRQAQRAMQKTMEQLRTTNADLKDAQTQLVQSEKMASLGLLVAGIAHEINTPVGAISSMHDTLLRAMDKMKVVLSACGIDARQAEQMEPIMSAIDDANRVIKTGTERVTTIVRRLRSFARLDEAELKTVDIHEGIEDTLTLIHHEIKSRIKLVREFGDLPQVTCYPGRLNQVFLNLLNNARQAIEGEGTITITTSVVDHQVSIRFADTGGGISPDDLKKIFDPGFTTKGVRVGTGLGLSICYQIIEDHRGKISVKSELGRGTTFTIWLPLNLEEQLEREKGERADDTKE